MGEALRELDNAAGKKVIRGEPRLPAVGMPADKKTPNKSHQPTEAAIPVSPTLKPLEAAPAAER